MQEVISQTERESLGRPALEDGHFFLSRAWIYEVIRTIQAARTKNEKWRKMASGFSLSLIYRITDLPQQLRAEYGDSKAAVLVRLEKGTVRKLWLGVDPPQEKVDFTIGTSYELAQQIFQGELNPAAAFIKGLFTLEPMSKVYRRPKFVAKSIVAGNVILDIARQVPTHYLDSISP